VQIDKNTDSTENIDFTEGTFILINKEKNWTSFDVVAKIRNLISKSRKIKKLKVGHGGTLDPLATGLMIVATGKNTKRLQEIQAETKEYIATICFGATTPSYDAETEIDATYPVDHITQETIEEALALNFNGDISQIPPSYSAKSVNGKRAYKSARQGEDVIIPAQDVTIFETEILEFAKPIVSIRIKCSKGTYIRSIAYDLGKVLKSGAYLKDLQRTKSGNFTSDNGITISNFEKILTNNI